MQRNLCLMLVGLFALGCGGSGASTPAPISLSLKGKWLREEPSDRPIAAQQVVEFRPNGTYSFSSIAGTLESSYTYDDTLLVMRQGFGTVVTHFSVVRVDGDTVQLTSLDATYKFSIVLTRIS